MTQNVKIHTHARLSATDRIKMSKNFSDFFFLIRKEISHLYLGFINQ